MDLSKSAALKNELSKHSEPQIVPIRTFFDGNEDLGSIGCNLAEHPGLENFNAILGGLLERNDVRGVYAQITELDPGEDSWPFTDTVLIVGSIRSEELEAILAPLQPDEVGPTESRYLSSSLSADEKAAPWSPGGTRAHRRDWCLASSSDCRCQPMNTRRQLSMYVPAAEGARLESLRQELDPVQAALIPAHVTLCREDEIVQLSDSEVEARLQDYSAKPLTLSFGPPVIFQGHGILLPCVAGEREFHELRSRVLGTSTIRRHAPHITLAHPRNPPSANRSLADAMRLPYPLLYNFVTIASIEQVGEAPWRVLRLFDLASLPAG